MDSKGRHGSNLLNLVRGIPAAAKLVMLQFSCQGFADEYASMLAGCCWILPRQGGSRNTKRFKAVGQRNTRGLTPATCVQVPVHKPLPG
jgi:hypothetical protein